MTANLCRKTFHLQVYSANGSESKEYVNRAVKDDTSITTKSDSHATVTLSSAQIINCRVCECILNMALFGRADTFRSVASFDECVDNYVNEANFQCKAGLYYENVRILSPKGTEIYLTEFYIS